jgi:acetolactate synthase-1/2/3 large subunit
MFGGLLAEVYELLPEDLRVFGDHGGFVGGGTATATGLALGEPSVRVVCALGDQGFTNGLQGLVAAVQESAPLTFVVCNNGGSVSLRKQSRPQGLLDRGFNRYLDNAAGMRYSEIATVLGMRSWRVDLSGWLEHDRTADCLEAFRQALSGATAHPGPTLIELVLPPDPEFWRGVWITEGFEAQKQTVPAGGGADIVRG